MARLFGTDGVRGIANKELTPEFAFKLGAAVCECIKQERTEKGKPLFVIGYDTRISSTMLQNAISAGIMSRGGNTLSAGTITTPAVSVLTKHYNADCGVVISASHNPYYDNGIKFFNAMGMKLSDETEDGIQTMLEAELPASDCINDELGVFTYDTQAKKIYTEHLMSVVPHSDLNGFKIILDCANGASFEVAPNIFKSLGADSVVINDTPDGININNACGSTHTAMMQKAVTDNKADFGFAFDGDADRLIACDEKGNEVNGDKIMYLFAKYLSDVGKLEKNTLVLTVMSNMGLKKILEKHNINIAETAVGDRYIIREMTAQSYNLGGEQSGHIILSDYNPTGDGIAAAMLLSHIIASSGRKLSELLSDFTEYPQILVNVKTTPKKKLNYKDDPDIINAEKALEDKYKDNGRILLRHSGTEPLVRVMIEGLDNDQIKTDAEYLASVIAEKLK